MIIFNLLIILFIFCIFLYYRNEIVFKARLRLVEEVCSLCEKDMENGLDWEWRYDELDRRSNYYKMVFQLFTFKWELPEDML